MILNENIFEIDIPKIIDTESELTIDTLEDNKIATPEESGVATLLTDSISDTWQKINNYNNIISTIASSNIENSENIISVLKDIVDDENKNVGKLISALGTLDSSTKNIEVGKEEANTQLTEDFSDSKADILSDVLGRSISSSEENYIYDGWRVFYNNPEDFRDTIVVEMINLDLDSLREKSSMNEDIENLKDLDVSINPVMQDAKEQSEHVQDIIDKKEEEIKKDIPKDEQQVIGALDQEVPKKPEEPKMSLDESIFNEASLNGYNYPYEAHWIQISGKDILLGGSSTLKDTENILKKQIRHLSNNPWMSDNEKYDVINSAYVYNSDEDCEVDISTDLKEFIIHYLDLFED